MPHEPVHSSTALELGAAILQQLPRDISQEVALGWIRNKKALGKGLYELLMPPVEASAPTEKPPTSLLELLRTADGSAQKAFKAADFFKEKEQPDGISFWIGENFKSLFLKGPGKIELDLPATPLNVYRLEAACVDDPIIAALGGKVAAQTCLAYMAQLIMAQPQGQEGVLHTNGWANIFYVEYDNGELWAVDCRWDFGNGKWDVSANPVTHPGSWVAHYRIFSPAVFVA